MVMNVDNEIDFDICYLVDTPYTYWIKPEDKERYGIEPNHLLADVNGKVVCGVLFQSANGPDFPCSLNLLKLLRRYEGNGYDPYIGTVYWQNKRANFLTTNPLKRFSRQLDHKLDIRKGTLGRSDYFFVDSNLIVVNEKRPELPF